VTQAKVEQTGPGLDAQQDPPALPVGKDQQLRKVQRSHSADRGLTTQRMGARADAVAPLDHTFWGEVT